MDFLNNLTELTPFYITFFWGVIFILNPKKENRARFWLGIFMITTSVVYFSHAVFFEGNYPLYLKIDWLYTLSGLSVFPLYYIYIRLLTRDTHFKFNFIWHFIPAVLISALLLLLSLIASSSDRQLYLKSTLILYQWPGSDAADIVKWMSFTYFTSRFIFGIQSITYLLMGLRLVKKYNMRVANFYSNLAGKSLVWVELLIITLIVASIVSFLVNIFGRTFFQENHLLALPSLLFSLLFFIIGLLGNKQNYSISDVVLDEKESESYPVHSLGDKQDLKEKLLRTMEKEHFFLDPNFRITTLSGRLYTNRTYLSNLINTEFKMSFSDFINQYRVEYAKALMENDSQFKYSLNHFAEKSGFGSLSSFNRAFKQFEGVTAGTYRQRLEKKVA
ncbi:MAG: AraC family transcriptional regulator [Bacteroidales bacterium]|nr:AraC family transcriptional regulator [Bacteroidales bacterium]